MKRSAPLLLLGCLLCAWLGFAVGCPPPPGPGSEAAPDSSQAGQEKQAEPPRPEPSREPAPEPTSEPSKPEPSPEPSPEPLPEPVVADAGPDASGEPAPELALERPPEPEGPCPSGATRPCFPRRGPVLGSCAKGSQTCKSDGSWGQCKGATLPLQESCNEKDDDCDGAIDEDTPGCVGTLAGTGQWGKHNASGIQASFHSPSALAVGPQGHLYITDTSNHVIRKIDRVTEVVSTYAGVMGISGTRDGPRGQALFYKPGALVFDAKGNLFVADTVNHRIRKIDLKGQVTTVAGSSLGLRHGKGAAARFYFPSGIALSPQGDIYVSDTLNHCIRKIDEQGNVTIFAGTTKAGHSNGALKQAEFNMPFAIATDAAGDLYVADSLNNMIRKIDVSTGTVSTLAGQGFRGYRDGPPTTALFYLPPGVAVAPDGVVYVADASNQRIRRIDKQGQVTTLAGKGQPGSRNGPLSQAYFFGPTGIAVSPKFKLYVADFNSHSIRMVQLK